MADSRPRKPSLRELEQIAYGTGSLDVQTKLKASREYRRLKKQEDKRLQRLRDNQTTDRY